MTQGLSCTSDGSQQFPRIIDTLVRTLFPRESLSAHADDPVLRVVQHVSHSCMKEYVPLNV